MKIAVYSTKQYDKKYLQHVNDAYGFELEFFDFLLTEKPPKPPTAAKRYAFS
jgi:D-lactate dehydrogenase